MSIKWPIICKMEPSYKSMIYIFILNLDNYLLLSSHSKHSSPMLIAFGMLAIVDKSI